MVDRLTVLRHWVAYRKDGSAPAVILYADRLAGFEASTVHRVEGPFVLEAEATPGAVEAERAEILTLLQEIADAEPRLSEARIAILVAAKRIRERGRTS